MKRKDLAHRIYLARGSDWYYSAPYGKIEVSREEQRVGGSWGLLGPLSCLSSHNPQSGGIWILVPLFGRRCGQFGDVVPVLEVPPHPLEVTHYCTVAHSSPRNVEVSPWGLWLEAGGSGLEPPCTL